jgi:arylformamidase
MKVYDVSLTVAEGMLAYPGDPDFRRRPFKSVKNGQGSNLSVLTMGSHTGTHVDAPRHIFDGTAGIDRVGPEILVGPCLVLEIKGNCMVELEQLKHAKLKGCTRILFKTANSRQIGRRRFNRGFTALTGAAAGYLVKKGIRLVGVDYLSVDRFHSGDHPAHRIFLKAGVVIIEGLNLKNIRPGKYELFCGPLKIRDGDGAPARVFLMAR